MRELDPASFPINDSAPLRPTTIFYLHKDTWHSQTTSIHNITSPTSPVDSIPSLSAAAATAKSATTAPQFSIRQEAWYKRTLTAVDSSGAVLAEASGPLLKLGQWKVKFPAGSEHASHEIELRPVGM